MPSWCRYIIYISLTKDHNLNPSNTESEFGAATGTLWTASSHIITAVIGSGVLSLAWAIGQLGWIVGPAVMILFALVIYYTSNLLADCYRTGDPVTGKRNYTYMDAVRANLGKKQDFTPHYHYLH